MGSMGVVAADTAFAVPASPGSLDTDQHAAQVLLRTLGKSNPCGLPVLMLWCRLSWVTYFDLLGTQNENAAFLAGFAAGLAGFLVCFLVAIVVLLVLLLDSGLDLPATWLYASC